MTERLRSARNSRLGSGAGQPAIEQKQRVDGGGCAERCGACAPFFGYCDRAATYCENFPGAKPLGRA
jgi:hypothetical protein